MSQPDVRTSEEILADIRYQIESGAWTNGTHLSEESLVDRYQCSRGTIRRAMRVLCDEGVVIVVREPGPVRRIPPANGRASRIPRSRRGHDRREPG